MLGHEQHCRSDLIVMRERHCQGGNVGCGQVEEAAGREAASRHKKGRAGTRPFSMTWLFSQSAERRLSEERATLSFGPTLAGLPIYARLRGAGAIQLFGSVVALLCSGLEADLQFVDRRMQVR